MRKLYGLILWTALCVACPVAAQQADSTRSQEAAMRALTDPDGAYLNQKEIRQLVDKLSAEQQQRLRTQLFPPQEYLPQHDVRISLGIAPSFGSWDVDNWDEQNVLNPAYEVLHSKYYDALLGRHCWGALSISYAYRLSKRWELGATLSYTGYINRLFRASDSREVETHREHYLSVMPMVRYTWLNRKRVRIYTSVELGVQLAMRRGFFEDKFQTEARFAGQIAAFGLTVGRKFFFCCELGGGSRGIVNVGFGCRIDTKKSKR